MNIYIIIYEGFKLIKKGVLLFIKWEKLIFIIIVVYGCLLDFGYFWFFFFMWKIYLNSREIYLNNGRFKIF